MSFAEYSNVTGPFLAACSISWMSSLFASSSLAYFFLNSSHFAGSCANQLRRSLLGAISLIQRSSFAFSFDKPLGHSLSINILHPSSLLAGS